MTEERAHRWDPQLYLAHADDRARPFVELLARVQRPGDAAPRRVVDLGCGPGHLTALMAERWPQAVVHGLDSSSEMVEAARRDVPADPRLSFEVADLRSWRPEEPVDLIVSNATLQWVPDHLALLPHLLAQLAPGGTLAFQVPGNEQAPSTLLRRELARDPRFAPYLHGVAEVAAHDPAVYREHLAPVVAATGGSGAEVDAWETTYLHVLAGEDPVFEWLSGTGARPTLQALPDGGDDSPRRRFASELRAALRTAYPASEHGTVLPFRRVFVVAHL
ncbi:methyltransferase domain-containing protein [Nocardioides sp. HDW12B]|uniref:methyltransferase domain-containing protein n=1 Tax=Nocardioides sp. HDW12B TaxID=2714939 RepID=UPI001407AF0D|nr:methyltransferase domain-containing protein [Nocardioides sp. HDW12B]QIK65363.1 methyltransferase domain-containing protein [Nocardioides sp. HDW12B]